jgi:hypothetical protein
MQIFAFVKKINNTFDAYVTNKNSDLPIISLIFFISQNLQQTPPCKQDIPSQSLYW